MYEPEKGLHGIEERDRRVVVRCPVEFWRAGSLVHTRAEDLSEHGVFIRADAYFPRGQIVDLQFRMPNGTYVRQSATVVHILPEGAARAMGRQAGMGLRFITAACDEILALIHAVEDKVPAPGVEGSPRCSVLVADASTPIFERLVTALGLEGHQVRTAATGRAALQSCKLAKPDLLLIDTSLADMSAWRLLDALAADPGLADVRFAMMGPAADDVARLKAYRAGAIDFIQKPFTDEEIGLRIGRMARPAVPPPTTVAKPAALTGNLSEVGLAMLLSLFDFEHKSGTVSIVRDSETTRLKIGDGQVVSIEGKDVIDPRTSLFEALDWHEGSFEFVAGTVEGENQFNLPTQQILLEHAQSRDEGDRDDVDVDGMFGESDAGA
jgi:CheY-like chemotaxis protein